MKGDTFAQDMADRSLLRVPWVERDPKIFGFVVWQLKEGEDKIIADRLVQILSGARKA